MHDTDTTVMACPVCGHHVRPKRIDLALSPDPAPTDDPPRSRVARFRARWITWDSLRWVLLSFLIYFVAVYPKDSADATRYAVGGLIELFTATVQVIAAFLTAAGISYVTVIVVVGAVIVRLLLDPRSVRKLVRRAGVDPEHEVQLMIAYISVGGPLTAAAVAVLAYFG